MPDNESPQDVIYFQLDRNVSGVVIPQADGARFAKLEPAQLVQVANTAGETGRVLIERLRNFDSKPSKIALEFGISVGGEAGIPFVAKGTLEAHFKVKLEWERSEMLPKGAGK